MGYYTKLKLDVMLKVEEMDEETKERIGRVIKEELEERYTCIQPVGSNAVDWIGEDLGEYKTKNKDKEDELYRTKNTLSINSSLKNYNNQIEEFLELIEPYVYYEGKISFLGYILEEEGLPSLIFIKDNNINIRQCEIVNNMGLF